MKIKEVHIKNFRSISNDVKPIDLNQLAILIGDNGTAKTAIIEAINYCLSPHFLSSRVKHNDFYNGTDEDIEIKIVFDVDFKASLPDGFHKRAVDCNGVLLQIHKREKGAPRKAFSDGVVVKHYVLPNRPKDTSDGWVIKRMNGTDFEFDERLLSFPVNTEELPKSFYFGKNREKQLKKDFNSSISSVFDDLNWRFAKNIRANTKDPSQSFASKKSDIEKYIIDHTDKTSIKKTFDSLNNRLVSFGIDGVKLSFLDGHAPYESAFISGKLDALDLPVSNLGSGIEMIISLLFLETLAALSKEKILILIDEPELHLHPNLQQKFVQYLVELSADNQIILTTHSPYFFKNCLPNKDMSLLVTKKVADNKIIIESTPGKPNFGLFPWSPSWGEINHKAYQLYTIEFHNELYGYLQEKEQKFIERDIELFFEAKGHQRYKQWIRLKNGTAEPARKVTLMTFIRNTIHHPENRQNADFTEQELKNSIKTMIALAK